MKIQNLDYDPDIPYTRKSRLSLAVGIILILIGLIVIIYAGSVYNHWKDREQYWDNEADYWHDYWIDHRSELDENEEGKENYQAAISKSSEAGSKAIASLWGFVIGFILILFGICPIILRIIR
ncbi:MAG: hypothetical protein JSW00_17715 [Thermoplasmata archaeon]|nr:MAG: hypothetical protein JSW00_17715 [Thermoplasmata archaeon]